MPYSVKFVARGSSAFLWAVSWRKYLRLQPLLKNHSSFPSCVSTLSDEILPSLLDDLRFGLRINGGGKKTAGRTATLAASCLKLHQFLKEMPSSSSRSAGCRDLRFKNQRCHCGVKVPLKIVEYEQESRGMLYFSCNICGYWKWCYPVQRGGVYEHEMAEQSSSIGPDNAAVAVERDEVERDQLLRTVMQVMEKMDKKSDVTRMMVLCTWVIVFVGVIVLMFK